MSQSTSDPILSERRPRRRRSFTLGVLTLGLFVVQAVIIGAAVILVDLPV